MSFLLATSHLMVTASYIFIPMQFCHSLSKSPHRHNIPSWRLIFCLILFAFFFFLCGMAHFLLAMGFGDTTLFTVIQCGNAVVSTTTALYLVPLIPDMFALLDSAISKMQNETIESKSKLFTFMAFLCHEIRNPLFAITSSAECLQDDTALNDEQQEEVSSICDSSLLMLRLVNDVLDLSKLESGKLQLECREFDLHSLLKRLGGNMARQVERTHQGAVRLECQWSCPQYVMGDSVRILQIVYNLLSNSCKFTSKGRILLTVEAMEYCDELWQDEHRQSSEKEEEEEAEEQVFSMALLGEDSSTSGQRRRISTHSNDDIEACAQGYLEERMVVLSITVADTGIGIPPERLEDIFEPYTQAKLSDFRQHGGTGLGLSIISSLTKTMGGTVSVTSVPGEGTKFHLKLPVKVPDDEVDLERNSISTRLSAKSNNVGELLPSDQKQVSENFLKCQRLPDFRDYSSVDSAAMAAEAAKNPSQHDDPLSSDQSNAINNAIKGASLFPPQPPTSPLVPPPLFETHNCPSRSPRAPLSPLSRPQRRNSLDTSTSGRAAMSSVRRANSFNLPLNDHVVLVVDDNSVNRKILGKMLRTFGIEHRMACNGQEAVDALLASRNYSKQDSTLPLYGLVLMDVSMPVMDGNTAIKTIRKANIAVPIVALSANVLSEERGRTISFGADEFHTKPILRNNLRELCERYLLERTTKEIAVPSGTYRYSRNSAAINANITPICRPGTNAQIKSPSCSSASLTGPTPGYGELNV